MPVINMGNSNIISRKIEAEVQPYLNELHDGLENVIDFGLEILDNDLNREGSDADLPALLFLRNLLGNIDAICVLVKNSVVEPCNNLLRTALENFFSIKYLLFEDTKAKDRAFSFLVWNFLEHQKWVKKADSKSKEHERYKRKVLKDQLLRTAPIRTMPEAESWIKIGEKLFELPGYKEVKAEYDRVKLKKKNPAWYCLFGGPNTIEELADRLGYPALYEILYRGWSGTIHGNNILQGKIEFGSAEMAEILPLRDPIEAPSIIQHCMNLCFLTYNIYVQKRTPQLQQRYNDWYQFIRPFYTSLVVLPESMKSL